MSEIFLEILNTGIMAGWLVLAVLVARLLLKKAPAGVKCALWGIVALRLVWPFEIESVLSLVPSTQTLPPEALYDPAPEIHTGIPYLNSTINPTFTQTFQPEPAASVNPLQVVVAVASVIWAIGMIVMAAYAAFSYLRLRRRVAVSMPAGEGVYLCDTISSPFILGLIKPKIYLPSDLPQEKWNSILSHERAHLARRDHWWKPLGFALLTVFWFHPLLWVAYVLLCRDVELACDEKVIKALSPEEKQHYSQTLLDCSVPRKWITACPLAFGETSVKQRIKAVLHYKKPTLWILIIALIACTVLAVCFLTEPESKQEANGDSSASADGQIVFQVTDLVHSPPALSYIPNLSGVFRITEENVLQYGYDKIYNEQVPNYNDSSWIDVGPMEAYELTEDNFDQWFSPVDPINMQNVAREIRENNRKAWRVSGKEGCFGCDCYFLEQTNGEIYFLYGQCYLFKLTESVIKETQISIAGKTYLYEKEGAGSGGFAITFHEDGTCSYYEGMLSSHLGFGTWTLEGDILRMDETRYNFLSGEKLCSYYFQVCGDVLIFQADRSDSFTYVKVGDGERFFLENSPEESAQINIAGNSYSYVKGGFGGPFTITLNADGTFFYYEGYLSSFIGTGTWTLNGDILLLDEDEMVFIFQVEEDGLIFQAENSGRFTFVDVADGDWFRLVEKNLQPDYK